MKLLPYIWVHRARLNQIKQELTVRKEQVAAAKIFIQEIGKGNLDASYRISDNSLLENELSELLINMRDQMKKIALDEKQRNWVTEGLAKFVEILRSKNNNLTELSDSIISNLVKYMNANQGALTSSITTMRKTNSSKWLLVMPTDEKNI